MGNTCISSFTQNAMHNMSSSWPFWQLMNLLSSIMSHGASMFGIEEIIYAVGFTNALVATWQNMSGIVAVVDCTICGIYASRFYNHYAFKWSFGNYWFTIR